MINLQEKQRRWAIPALYAAIFLLLGLAIWNPTISRDEAAIDLMLLLDESQSIDPRQNNIVWQSFMQHASLLPAGSRISLIRFADSAKVEIPWTDIKHTDFAKFTGQVQPPRHRYLDRSASDLRLALDTAFRQTLIHRQTVILISSDGVDTVNPKNISFPALYQNPDVSLLYRQSTPVRQPGVTRIDSINLPRIIYPGQSLPLSIAIDSGRKGQSNIEIILNNKIAYQQAIELQAEELQVLNLQLPTGQAATQRLDFIIRNQQQQIIDKQSRVVEARDGRQLLYIGEHTFNSISTLAQTDGWKTVQLKPHQLPNSETFFDQFDMVLINDTDASSIDAPIILNLQSAIRRSGTGLIVLGGPHSFGSGGYRHSELEQILPVTAEASRPLPAAAFLFLLDKSGSMEASSSVHSRLSVALRAVSESAKSIRAGDESALLAFDREVQILLPLKHRANLKSDLDQAWQIQPSGGTQLGSALKKSMELLATSDSSRRFLILVTDGIVNIDNMKPLKKALQEANIRLIAITTGNDANPITLQQLTAINEGRILHINDTAQLPRFMRQQLETTQDSWNDISVTPQMTLRLPFITERNSHWKNLQGYQITHAKPATRVYLKTAQGDPLLAVAQYGAGQVAALPGGLLETISSDNLLPALLNWMNNRQHNPNFQVSHRYSSSQLTLVIDAVTSDHSWQTITPAQVILTNPAGTSSVQPLQMIAPGRFSAVMEAPNAGIYKAGINIGNQQVMVSLYLENDRERKTNTVAGWLKNALKEGDIKPWTETSLDNSLTSSSTQYETGRWWLLLVLPGYLGLMALERSSIFYWVKISFPKFKLKQQSK